MSLKNIHHIAPPGRPVSDYSRNLSNKHNLGAADELNIGYGEKWFILKKKLNLKTWTPPLALGVVTFTIEQFERIILRVEAWFVLN